MEEGRHEEETKYEEQNLVACHHPLSPSEPLTCLMITDRKNGSQKNGSERHMFYSFTEDHNFARLVHELEDKNVACCHGGWLILSDKSTNDCSILNILTMEKLELPPLPSKECTDFVMSSPVIDRSCRFIFIERVIWTWNFWSCHLGDSEFIKRKLYFLDEDEIISDHINFKGKLYAVTTPYLNLIAIDFSDPNLDYEQVISGESLDYLCSIGGKYYLVESCEDLLLICIGSYSHEVSDVQVFKAEFDTGEWVDMETLDDRTIFLGSCSSPALATTLGMNGNAIYWVTTPSSKSLCERRLYMYDIEDESITMSLLDPIVPPLFAVSFPTTCDEDKRSEEKATIKSSMIQIEQRKTEETETIIAGKENLWADLPTELLHEILSHLFAGDSIAFRSVCRSWYSPSPLFDVPILFESLGFSSPLLMRSDYPIDCMDYLPGAKVRTTLDGWLLMDYYSTDLIFYNPVTKTEFLLPSCEAKKYYSVCFSAPPTSTDCLVVVAAKGFDETVAICFKKFEDEDWTCCEITSSFRFSYCNAVVYKGLYYFLGKGSDVGRLLIFDPMKEDGERECVIKAPNFFHEREFQCEEQYMLEGDDGKLIAVFVGAAGSSVYTCEWNVCTSEWKILESLGNMMLFVSRPLSFCKRATVRGTGNKIYFPRLVNDDQVLFYSLATRRYHTFEMGSCYSNFSASKYFHDYNGWFIA